jgi:hypothetical protein
MNDGMSAERLERLAGLAELPCTCTNADCGNYASALTAQEARELAAEARRLRARLDEIGDEWGYETMNSWSGWRRCISSMTEEYARKRAGESDRNRLVHRKAGEWREVPDA